MLLFMGRRICMVFDTYNFYCRDLWGIEDGLKTRDSIDVLTLGVAIPIGVSSFHISIKFVIV